MIKFNGIVNSIVFENNQDLYKVLDVEIVGKLEDYQLENIRVTGNFGKIEIGEKYRFEGQLVHHNTFGLQFKVNTYHQEIPQEQGSLIKYLSSSKFPGIGKRAAESIIDELGSTALTVLKNKPAKISELSLSQKQKDSLLSGINSMDSFSEIILKLSQYGIKNKVAERLYKLYHGETIKKIETDPYAAIDEVSGYAFKSADNIGKELGIDQADPRRIKGAIYQIILDSLNNDGNTYIPLKTLLTATSELLKITQYDPIAVELNHLQEIGKVVVDGNNAALADIFRTEVEIARLMKKLVDDVKQKNSNTNKYDEKTITKAINTAEKKLEIKYDQTQKMAIKNAVLNPISILTGGPGTGKTTVINGILMVLQKLENIPKSTLYSEDPPFLLAAPTGRAAKRMSEVTDVSAKTIHRLLGIGIADNLEENLNQLNGTVLIIDEMSMVDMFLFKRLLSSINKTQHIVFVGDKDQLPSVGPGNIFADLIKSDTIPTTILKQIHRQGDDSTIIDLAHAINEGNDQDILFQKTKNYSFIPCKAHLVGDAISQIVKLALSRGFQKDDIQILSAMYHGTGGITNLNNIIQKIMNPAKNNTKTIESHDEIFQIGDRVLQLQNNAEKDIYNGQIGKVIGIEKDNPKKCLIANFDGREIEFNKKDLFDLTRAYAITIHKSQGSEFPVVILDLTMQNYVMLKRNLLYTAVTRAKKNLVLVGEPQAYVMALKTPGNDRKTGLVKQLQDLIPIIPSTASKVETKITATGTIPKKYVLTKEKIYSGLIDPMIGMDKIVLNKNS